VKLNLTWIGGPSDWMRALGEKAGEIGFRYGFTPDDLPSWQFKLPMGAAIRIDWLSVLVFAGLAALAVVTLVVVLIAFSKQKTRASAIPEVTAIPARPASDLDLRIVSHEDARRLHPEFFRRSVSRSFADFLSFSHNAIDSAHRFLRFTAQKFPADSFTLFLRNESLLLEPVLQMRGGFISGNAVEGPLLSQDDLAALESGRVVVSGDSAQALIPIDAPTELAGILHVSGHPGLCEGAKLGLVYEIARQFSLLFYERVRHERVTLRQGLGSPIRFEEDLSLLCRQQASFSLIVLDAPLPPGSTLDLPHRMYSKDGLVYLLGPVESDPILDDRFRSILRTSGRFNAGIAVSRGLETPDRVLRRAHAALANARSAGPNHYRILNTAA
jgi:hypothetical protein